MILVVVFASGTGVKHLDSETRRHSGCERVHHNKRQLNNKVAYRKEVVQKVRTIPCQKDSKKLTLHLRFDTVRHWLGKANEWYTAAEEMSQPSAGQRSREIGDADASTDADRTKTTGHTGRGPLIRFLLCFRFSTVTTL